MSAVFVYGGLPFPGAGEREIPDFITPDPQPLPSKEFAFEALKPCPKCKRHCRENECPFCYADSLRLESTDYAGANATLDLLRKKLAAAEAAITAGQVAVAKIADERDEARRERDALKRKLDAITDLVVNGVAS